MKKKTKHFQMNNPCDPEEVSYLEVKAVLSVLTGKWKILIIWKLWHQKKRFGELKRALPGITQHTLTVTLKELEREGLVIRNAFAEIPPKVEYSLTKHAETLEPILMGLKKWGKAHLKFMERQSISSSSKTSLKQAILP